MNFIKREEIPQQTPIMSDQLTHGLIYQNQQLPINIVEQIHLAMQNGSLDPQLQGMLLKPPHDHTQILRERDAALERVGTTINRLPVESQERNLILADQALQDHRGIDRHVVEHRASSVHDHRVLDPNELSHGSANNATRHIGTNCQVNMNHRVNNVQIGIQTQRADRPAREAVYPLHNIKTETEPEETHYYYEQMIQAYTGSGNLQIDNNALSLNQDGQTNPVQYVFNSQPNVLPVAVDQFGRQQFFQNYTINNSAENLVVHRQCGADAKKERAEPVNKTQQTDSQNENAKPNNVYRDEQWAKGEGNKNTDDAAYKNLIDAEYANIKGEYICSKCNSIFPNKRSLKQHGKTCSEEMSNDKVGKFSCGQCPYKCQSPAILKIHERTHTGEKPFSCNFCDYKSGQKNNVAKHILVHLKEKPFRCQYCEYRCAQKNNLVVHERTHTGFKPFACTLCEYKTVQKPNLVKHMYLHTGQKPFSCDMCSYKCVQKTNLTKHKQRHLNEKEKVDSKNRPYKPRQKTYKCVLCSFSYAQKQDFDRHMQCEHASSEQIDFNAANEDLDRTDMCHVDSPKGVENLSVKKVYQEDISMVGHIVP